MKTQLISLNLTLWDKQLNIHLSIENQMNISASYSKMITGAHHRGTQNKYKK